MTLDEIRAEHRARFAPCTRWIIVETPEGYEVHEWTPEGVAPPSVYPSRRLAAARLLQLMRVGPVAPQTHPEEVCICAIEQEPAP
jgi:hypothetical protein